MTKPFSKPEADAQQIWRRVRAILRAEMGERPFELWVAPFALVSADDDRVTLKCEDSDVRDVAAARYGVRIADLFAEHSGVARAVDFIFEPQLAVVGAPKAASLSPLDKRFAFLKAKAAELARQRPGFAVGDDVLRMMSARIPKDDEVLEAALTRLAERSIECNAPATLATAQLLLADFLRAHDRRITIDEVKRIVSRRRGLKPGELESKSRRSELVWARHIAIYAAREFAGKSFPEIGRQFHRDHSSAMHGFRKVSRLKKTNPVVANELDEIKNALRDWTADLG